MSSRERRGAERQIKAGRTRGLREKVFRDIVFDEFVTESHSLLLLMGLWTTPTGVSLGVAILLKVRSERDPFVSAKPGKFEPPTASTEHSWTFFYKSMGACLRCSQKMSFLYLSDEIGRSSW